MSHTCKYTTELKWGKDNQFYFETTATWKDKSATVMRQYDNGEVSCRYIYVVMGYYRVAFPNERIFPQGRYGHYGYQIQQEEEFDKCVGSTMFVSWDNQENDLKEIAEKREDLKFLCKKFDGSIDEFIKAISIYKDNPEIEPLLECGLNEVALNKNLWRMTAKRRLEVMKFIRKHLESVKKIQDDNCWLNLVKVTRLMKKFPNSTNLYRDYIIDKLHLSEKEARYCDNKNVEYGDYSNYLIVVSFVGHNLKEDYWAFPNNFEKQLAKVNAEKHAIEKAEEIQQDTVFGLGLGIYKKLSQKTEKVIRHYKLYIPYKVDDVKNQAAKLNQCLIRCNYIDKMANQESVLIFIKDLNDEPIATCEVDWKKEILQIYGHEYGIDREASKVTHEVASVVKEYLKNVKLDKKKLKKSEFACDETIYYKGVTSDLSSISGSKKITYEVGKVYDTKIKNDEFNVECKSSNKAIHFCKDIHKAMNFVHADKIIVLQALGRVCHVGDEYFSNKIKVVDIVQC